MICISATWTRWSRKRLDRRPKLVPIRFKCRGSLLQVLTHTPTSNSIRCHVFSRDRNNPSNKCPRFRNIQTEFWNTQRYIFYIGLRAMCESVVDSTGLMNLTPEVPLLEIPIAHVIMEQVAPWTQKDDDLLSIWFDKNYPHHGPAGLSTHRNI